MTPILLNEQETRYSITDPLIKKAEWNPADFIQECSGIPLQKYDKIKVTGFHNYCFVNDKVEITN